jgi:catechol 2,3-dioxygenase-like lactoylglutathione lyase family enzyme
VSINVRDAAESIAFYTDVLGIELHEPSVTSGVRPQM